MKIKVFLPHPSHYLLVIILFIGFALRIYNLGNNSFWSDEAHSLRGASMIFFLLKNYSQFRTVTYIPTFLISLHFWQHLGSSEFILRLLPLIFGLFSIVMIFKLACELFNYKTGVISAFLLAVSPFHIYYSQEIRPYTFMTSFTLLSVFFLIKFLKNRKYTFCIGYIIFNVLNIYSHPAAFLMLIAQAVYLLCYGKKYKEDIPALALSHFLILLTLAPLLATIFGNLSRLNLALNAPYFHSFGDWIPKPSIVSIFFTLKNFSIGYNAVKPIYLLAAGVCLILFCKGIFNLVREKEKEKLVLVLTLCILPVLISFFISQFKRFFVDRHFISSALFYYIIIAYGLSRFKRRNLLFVMIIILSLISSALINYYVNYLPKKSQEQEHIGVHARKEYREAAQHIMKNFQIHDDVILHTSKNTFEPFRYYLSKNAQIAIKQYLLKLENSELLPCEYLPLEDIFKEKRNLLTEKIKRVWLIFSSWEFTGVNQPELSIVEVINSSYKKITETRFKDIIVYLYEKEE